MFSSQCPRLLQHTQGRGLVEAMQHWLQLYCEWDDPHLLACHDLWIPSPHRSVSKSHSLSFGQRYQISGKGKSQYLKWSVLCTPLSILFIEISEIMFNDGLPILAHLLCWYAILIHNMGVWVTCQKVQCDRSATLWVLHIIAKYFWQLTGTSMVTTMIVTAVLGRGMPGGNSSLLRWAATLKNVWDLGAQCFITVGLNFLLILSSSQERVNAKLHQDMQSYCILMNSFILISYFSFCKWKKKSASLK